MPGVVLRKGALVGRLPEGEELKDVRKEMQNKITANLTMYPGWALYIHFQDFSSKDQILFCKSYDLNAKDRPLVP